MVKSINSCAIIYKNTVKCTKCRQVIYNHYGGLIKHDSEAESSKALAQPRRFGRERSCKLSNYSTTWDFLLAVTAH